MLLFCAGLWVCGLSSMRARLDQQLVQIDELKDLITKQDARESPSKRQISTRCAIETLAGACWMLVEFTAIHLWQSQPGSQLLGWQGEELCGWRA